MTGSKDNEQFKGNAPDDGAEYHRLLEELGRRTVSRFNPYTYFKKNIIKKNKKLTKGRGDWPIPNVLAIRQWGIEQCGNGVQ